MIQELKNKVGQSAENIITQGLGLEGKGKKYRCPKYSQHKNGDKNPSMSWDSKALQMYCFTCGFKIDIYGYYRNYLGREHTEIMRDFNMIEDKPQAIFNLEPITKECIEYLKQRKITEETIKNFQIQSYKGNIAFPYYNRHITGVKYRQPKQSTGGPKYLSIIGSDFGFFNKQNIKSGESLIICEGEIDCMILYQAGFLNSVSVGTGANSLDKLFRQEKHFLESFQSLVIVSDNDEAGKKMDAAFIKEFGAKAKIVDKSLFKEKDINLEYYYYGESKIKEIIESAIVKIEGLRSLDKEPYKGVESIKGRYIPTGINTIDYAINDLGPGQVTLITGRSNDGKSTLVNQIMVNAIDKDNKVLLVSGEGLQEILINKFYKAVIGRDDEYFNYRQINKRKYKEPKKKVLEALRKWHKGKFTLFNKGDSPLKTMDQLFDLINLEVKTNKHNLVVIDNLMSVLSVEKASEKLEAQGDFMQRCCDLAKCERIHIILVLHPNKTLIKGKEMDFEQISGTQDLANKADNIIVVRKEYDQDVKAQGVSGEISVIKNRYYSDLPKVKTYYEQETGMLLEIAENGDILAYSFGWFKYLNGEQTHIEGFQPVVMKDPWS